MASATATKRMREEATCSICLSLMTEPQSIRCGHSFCRRCIEDVLDFHGHQQPSLRQHSCPQCRAPFRRKSLRPNKQLENLIEIIKGLDQEMVCTEHGEKLHLFCEDDGQLICWRCERSPQYKGHDTTLVQDASPGYKVSVWAWDGVQQVTLLLLPRPQVIKSVSVPRAYALKDGFPHLPLLENA